MEYINNNKEYLYSFIPMPKSILYKEPYKSKLSDGAKLTLIYMLDLINLSRLNNHYNEYGNIYIFCSKKNIQDLLNVTNKTAIKYFTELKELNIIKTISQGDGKTYQIFLSSELFIASQIQKDKENLHSTYVKKEMKGMEKIHTNNIKNNNINGNISSSIELDKIKDKCLLSKFNKTVLKTGVSIGSLFNSTIDTLFYLPVLTIDNRDYNNSEIRTLLSGLTEDHLNKAESIFITNYENVRNYKSYLITCISNVLLGKEIPKNMMNTKKYISNYKGREYSKEFMESLYDNLDSPEEESQELEL